MGSSSQYRPAGYSHREFFGEMLNAGTEIVECSTVRSVFYAAVRDSKTEKVSALVVKFSWQPKSDFNFTYKVMDEFCGPCYYDAPAKVLDALTETDSEYAVAWREKCREALARKAAVPRVRIGDTLEFTRPISFTNGDVLDTFTLVRRGVFRSPETGSLYRLGSYRDRGFRILGRGE